VKITKLKQQLEKMWLGDTVQHIHSSVNGGMSQYHIDRLPVVHLQALCASHTALEAQVAEMKKLITELDHGHYGEAVQERIEAFKAVKMENKDAR
jgi:hypothetical protein